MCNTNDARPLLGLLLDIHPLVALCCGHSAALGLQDWPLHMYQKIIYGMNVGMGQLIILVLCLGNCRSSSSSPLSLPPGVCVLGEGSPALSWLVRPLQQRARVRPILMLSCPQGSLSHTNIFSDGSMVLSGQGSKTTLWSVAAGEGQKQISHTYDFRASSPTISGIGRLGGRAPLPHPCRHMAE